MTKHLRSFDFISIDGVTMGHNSLYDIVIAIHNQLSDIGY